MMIISLSSKELYAQNNYSPAKQVSNVLVNSNLESKYLWEKEAFGNRAQSSEIIELRDANSKHFKNENGDVTAFITAGNINYLENGKWKTIFHSIVSDANGFSNTTNFHKTYYPQTAAGAITTILPSGETLVDMKDMRMYYLVGNSVVQPLTIAPNTGTVDFNELTYSNVYGNGIDLKLTQHTTIRKMDYIIQNLNALATIPTGAEYLVFEEKVVLPNGWNATLTDENYILVTGTNGLKAVFNKPVFIESPSMHTYEVNGESHTHSGAERIDGTYQLEQNGTVLTIKTLVPIAWLTAAERTFPVTIDPSVNMYPNNANWWTGTIHTYGNTPTVYTETDIYDAYDDEMIIGKGNYDPWYGYYESDDCYHSWAKFNLTTLPSTCLSTVSFHFYTADDAGVIGSGCFMNFNVKPLAYDPVPSSNATVLADIRDGSLYGSFSLTSATESGWQNLTLNATATSDFIASIPTGWFGLGLSTTGIASGHYDFLWIRAHSHANKPYILVDYPLLTTQPVTTNICTNGSGSFTVGANATSPSYLWQYSTNGGSTWLSTVGVSQCSGQTTNTLTITNPPLGWNNTALVRCAVTSGSCTLYSNAVLFAVKDASTAPTTVTGGGNYCFGNSIALNSSGGTSGDNAVYAWYKGGCNNAFTETWMNLSSTYTFPNTTVNSTTNGILNVTSTNNDPMIHMPNIGSFSPTTYRYVNIRYRVVSGTANSAEIFFYNAHYPSANAAHQTSTSLISDGNWHIATIDLTQNSHYLGDGSNITGWRYDWATNAGCTMELDFIQLSQYPMIDEDNTTTALEWTPAHPHYPGAGTTTYATTRIDNCGATSCASTTVTLPSKTNVLATDGESATCTVNANETVHFYNTTSGRYIASVSAGATGLGSTVATTYVAGSPIITTECGNPTLETAVLARHWVINPTTNVGATVRLPYYNSELTALYPASTATTNPIDDISAQAQLGLSKYSGPLNVNSSWADNCPPSGNGNTTYQMPNGFADLSTYSPLSWPANGDKYSWFVISGFSEFWLHGSQNLSPLAVVLSDFSTTCADEYTHIRWTTASEQNSDYFTVEYSRDGSQWKTIETVDGAGTINTSQQYQITTLSKDEGYYRLKQTDTDGTTKTLETVFSACKSTSNSMNVYPNPSNGTFTLQLNSSEELENAVITIQELSGRIVEQRWVNVKMGTNSIYFENNQLNAGSYIISVNGKESAFSPLRMVIQ